MGLANGDIMPLFGKIIKYMIGLGILNFAISLITAWIMNAKSEMNFWLIVFIVWAAIGVAEIFAAISIFMFGKMSM